MRIVHVITRLILGGAQENTLETVIGLHATPGLDVSLIAGPTHGPEGSLEGRAVLAGVRLVVAPDLIRPVHPWRDARALADLTRRFRADRPDLVHTHSGKAGVLGRLAARWAGTPLVVHTVHGPSFGPFQGRAANAAYIGAERLAGRCTDHFIVVADAMREQYLAAGIGTPEKYTRVFSGFALEPYLGAARDPELARRLGLSDDDFVIGSIARLAPLKGHEDLLRAAPSILAAAPGAKFLWVGDGPLRPALAASAARLGLAGRIVFAGLVAPDAVPRYAALMDCLAHLSRREGLPRALPQAMAAGKPVVAYDADGAREACQDGVTGFLRPVGDIDGTGRALVALARDPELRRRLGETGRRWVAARFQLSHLVQGQAAVYRRLAAERGIAFPGAPS